MENKSSNRGTKRKRYEPPPQDLGVKIKGKLHHDLKEVKKAAKKAKAFEMQKLGKKLKDLRKKAGSSKEIQEIEKQLELLKEINHELVAGTALKTKLNKNRILCDDEHIQAAISQELATDLIRATLGTDAAKVQSRLLSSKILATEVATAVNDMMNIIQPPTAKGEDEEATERPQKVQKVVNQVKELNSMKPATASSASPYNVEGEEGLDKNEDVGWESGTVSEDDAEEAGWESGSISDNGDINSAEESDDNDDDDDDDDDLSITPSSATESQPKVLLTKTSGKGTSMHSSTFLPSLSVGFTRGESDDSDLSESEMKIADVEVKKNRRGQRARRAIWEKKFGKNANHKKKEAQIMERRGKGTGNSSNRRPPRHDSRSKVVPLHPPPVDAGWGQRAAVAQGSALSKSTAGKTFVKGRAEEKPMHPSWEAKRKLKEKESAGILPSQGKKIKFS